MGPRSRVSRNDIWDDLLRYLILILVLFSSCARSGDDPVIAQMRLRKMQTRTFVGATAKAVSKELLAVLQDEGFIVKNVSNELGLITAERDTNIEKLSSKFWAYVFSGKKARWNKHSLIEITSNISEEPGKTKIRINLLLRVFDNLGRIVDVHQVLEEEAYIDFFNKVQRGLLVHS